MKAEVKEFDLDAVVTLDARLTFKIYDFDAKAFPVEGMTKTGCWYPISRYPTGKLPGSIRFYFSNPELLHSIQLDAETARKFLETRKRNG